VRLHYTFPENMPLVTWDNATDKEIELINHTFLNAKHDVLNDKVIQLQNRAVSLLELPEAPDESLTYKREGILRGQIKELNFDSDILQNQRKIWVYNSPDSEDAKNKNLLLVLDGAWYLSLIPTQRILDNLFHDSCIGPTTAVFIDNVTPTSRNVELSYNAEFANFIEKELIPWVRDYYDVSENPVNNSIAGSSLGGLSSMWLGFNYPHIFGNVICQAGVISKLTHPDQPQDADNRLTTLFEQSAKLPLRVWLEVGLMDDLANIVEPTRHMAAILRAKEYDFDYHEYAGGHDFALWRGTLAQALKKLLQENIGDTDPVVT
jgi:enterochelin esterase family protein